MDWVVVIALAALVGALCLVVREAHHLFAVKKIIRTL